MGFADLYLNWNDDLIIGANGDLLTASDTDLLKQRIIRRIYTNKKDLLFEPDFGAGLPIYVWEDLSPANYDQIQQRILNEIYKEEVVVRNPAPVITFTPTYNSLTISIQVWTTTSQQVALEFEVKRAGL